MFELTFVTIYGLNLTQPIHVGVAVQVSKVLTEVLKKELQYSGVPAKYIRSYGTVYPR